MAVLGEWRGDTTTLLPTTTWAAPNALFSGTAIRNDSAAYGFAASTSTVTLPSSGLANGYLVTAAFEFEDASNGRHNPQGRFILASGTGDFVTGTSSGYNRDNSEDRSYVRTWAFVSDPSALATLQFQWRRDSDAPTGGTVRSQLQITPIPYAQIGMYSSTSTACPGGTTPNQVTGFSVVSESDTAAIELASNVVTVKGDNKRYLALGGQYWQGIGNARTQRWHGFRIDGTKDDTAKGYSYGRNAANADVGEMFTTIVATSTADRTIDQFVYRGDAVGTFPNSGADVDGNVTGANPQHSMVVLELNDSAEVFLSQSDTQQDIDVAGARVNLQIADTVSVNDASSFTASGTTGINLEQDADVLLGANVSGGYASTSTARYTGYAELTKNGTGETYSVAGDYGRGNQSTQDCWGWSANLLGFLDGTTGDDLGVNAGKIAGGEGGTVDTLGGWVGFWGVNLDTLQDVGGGPVSGTGAITAPVPSLAGSGNVLVDGAGGVVAPVPALGGSGTVGSATSGSGAVVLPLPVSDGSGSILIDGSAAATLPLPALSGAGAVGSAPSGSGAAVLSLPTIAGSGEVLYVGTGAALLPMPSLGGSGDILVGGSGAINLPLPLLAGSGTTESDGSGDALLPVPLVSGSGDISTIGAGGALLPVPALDGTGVAIVSGDGAIILPMPSLAGSGTSIAGVDGAGAASLPLPVIAGSGIAANDGTGVAILPVPLLSGAGTVSEKTIGVGAVLLPMPLLYGYVLRVSCTLVDRNGAALPNLTLLSWAWFDETDPGLFGAPVDQGQIEQTDGTATFSIALPNSALIDGQLGTLVLRSDSGASIGVYTLPVAA